LGQPRERSAVEAKREETEDVPQACGLATRQKHPGDRVEHVLEDGSARECDAELLIEVQTLEETVRVRLPGLLRILPRGRQDGWCLLSSDFLLLCEDARGEATYKSRDEDEEGGAGHGRR